MNKNNNNALSICRYILDSMIYRQKVLGEEGNLKNKLALIEVSIDQDLKDKNKYEKKDLINVVKNKEISLEFSYHKKHLTFHKKSEL